MTEHVHDVEHLTVLNPNWPDEGIPVFGNAPEPAHLDADWTTGWHEDHQQQVNDWMEAVLPDIRARIPEALRQSDLMWVEPHFRYDCGCESGVIGFAPLPSVVRSAVELFATDGWGLLTVDDPAAPDYKSTNSQPDLIHPDSSEPIEFNLDFELPWVWTTPLPITCEVEECGCRDWLAEQKVVAAAAAEVEAERVREDTITF